MKPNQAMTHGHLPSAVNKINVYVDNDSLPNTNAFFGILYGISLESSVYRALNWKITFLFAILYFEDQCISLNVFL